MSNQEFIARKNGAHVSSTEEPVTVVLQKDEIVYKKAKIKHLIERLFGINLDVNGVEFHQFYKDWITNNRYRIESTQSMHEFNADLDLLMEYYSLLDPEEGEV